MCVCVTVFSILNQIQESYTIPFHVDTVYSIQARAIFEEELWNLMRINLSRIPNFVLCLFLSALLAFTLRDEFSLDLTFAVPISLFFVLQLQKRGLLG